MDRKKEHRRQLTLGESRDYTVSHRRKGRRAMDENTSMMIGANTMRVVARARDEIDGLVSPVEPRAFFAASALNPQMKALLEGVICEAAKGCRCLKNFDFFMQKPTSNHSATDQVWFVLSTDKAIRLLEDLGYTVLSKDPVLVDGEDGWHTRMTRTISVYW